MHESTFLHNLIGKPVTIVSKAAIALEPQVLREVSDLGVVAEDGGGAHFFPWIEVAEISPCAAPAELQDLALAVCADSEL